MLAGMNLFLDSFWRALVYTLRPRVIALSFLPLVLLVVLSAGLVYFYWEPAVYAVQVWLGELALLESLMRWLESVGAGNLRSVVAPLVLLMFTLPVVIILSLLAVAAFMTPALVTLVAELRFPRLERRHGGTFWRGLVFALGTSLLAALALVVSMPLWLIPPLVVVLPPLVWGWLTYRVMAYDTLAEHASREERAELLRRHRLWMLAIGILTGYLGAAPGLVWAVGAMAIVFAPLLVPLAIWIYTFVFAFSSLWFAHFCLAALQALRAEAARVAPTVETVAAAVPPDAGAAPVLPHEAHNDAQPGA
jgi:hypothetical protein